MTMKRLTIDMLLAGTLAVAPLAWAQAPSGSMQDRNDTTTSTPQRTGPAPSTTQRNTPPYPGDDPAAPQRVPSETPAAGMPTPSTAPPTTVPPPSGDETVPSQRGTEGNPATVPGATGTEGTTGSQGSTTTGSERAGNQPSEGTPAARTDETPGDDLALIQKVHAANEKELELAYLAADKSHSQKVKSYARKLVSDHKAMDRQLMTYARRKGLSTKLEQASASTGGGATTEGSDMRARLNGETGREFDQDFVATMVDEHDKAIALIRSSRDAATDPQLRDIFELALPKLEKHRKMAQDLVDTHAKS
jgi:putative membrane protein